MPQVRICLAALAAVIIFAAPLSMSMADEEKYGPTKDKDGNYVVAKSKDGTTHKITITVEPKEKPTKIHILVDPQPPGPKNELKVDEAKKQVGTEPAVPSKKTFKDLLASIQNGQDLKFGVDQTNNGAAPNNVHYDCKKNGTKFHCHFWVERKPGLDFELDDPEASELINAFGRIL